jgi:hypothetical protein
VPDQGVHGFALIGRVGDDRVGVAIPVERQRVLAGRDVAGMDATQPERFQMAHQRAVTTARLGERAYPPRKCGISGGTAAAGVG